MAAVRDHFKPEFLNRVDEIVRVPPLVGGRHRAHRRHPGRAAAPAARRRAACELELTPKPRKWIAKTGYDPDFGARPLKRVLQREVADPIALELLKGDVPDTATRSSVDAKPDGGLVFDSAATAEIVT